MSGPTYGTRAGLYRHIRRGELTEAARRIGRVDATLDRLELANHGFTSGEAVQFNVEANGALPAPLTTGVVYYALLVAGSSSLFQVEASVGGGAISLLTEGSGGFGVIDQGLDAKIDFHLAVGSRRVDGFMNPNGGSYASPYPDFVVHASEVLAALSLVRSLKRTDEQLEAEANDVVRDLMRFAKGDALKSATGVQPVNTAKSFGRTARGWRPADGVVP